MSEYSKFQIQKMIEESDNSTIAKEKGDKLELLVKYLFANTENLSFIGRDILDAPRAHEIDIAFWNPNRNGGLSFLDPVIVIECKNHSSPIGSIDIGWFVRKLQDRGARNGIFISLSGITGKFDGQTCVHSEILNAMMRDGIKILVMKREDLLGLNNSDDLVNLLMEKFLKLTLYRSIE